MENPNFISVYEGVATDKYCQNMIDAWEEIHEKSSSVLGVARGEDSNGGTLKRKDCAYYFEMENQEMAQATYEILNICLEKYIDEHPSLGSHNLISTTVKVQKTLPKGGFHNWHCEQTGWKDMLRALTWTIYLNDVPDGEGETEFLEYGVRVKPKRGDVCIFPAGWTHTHRGNAVYNANKYIATGWWYGQENESY